MKKLTCLLLILIFSSFCGPNQDKVNRIIEDGVEIVLNQIEPFNIHGEATSLYLEEEFTINIDRKDLKEKGLRDIWHFDIDSENNIYLTSSAPNTKLIFKFDQNGQFIKTFGKKDQETGEFFPPKHIRLSQNDEIFTVNGLGNIMLFNTEGEFIKEIPRSLFKEIPTGIPNEKPRSSDLLDVYPLRNGNYLIFKSLNYYTIVDHYCPLILCDSERRELIELGALEVPGLQLALFKKIKGFFPRFSWDVSRERIFVGDDQQGYEIHVYDLEGNLVRKIRKKYKPVPVTNIYKERSMALFAEASWIDKVYFPGHFPPYQYLFTDEEGHLFVMTYETNQNGNGYVYDIFNSDGVFIGNTSLGNYGMPTYANEGGDGPLEVKVKRDRLYCTRMNKNGLNELVVYKMRWE